MIDPKLNELPVKRPGETGDAEDASLSEAQREERMRRASAGMSINDTIARDANLSVGSRGVDTSGVVSGAGAGAGSTFKTPAQSGGSPAPNVVPGARGTGFTPRSDTASGQSPSGLTTETPGAGPRAAFEGGGGGHQQAAFEGGGGGHTLDDREIAARAYRCWHERGCPEGSPEVDWERARRELEAERQRRASTASA
ncbi:MAG: DUF2934 domain-containing protein [Acidobacteriaceae bacterium]|nr:DUF2934 domain-containing protein [Acidobacteriaceae bacterium]